MKSIIGTNDYGYDDIMTFISLFELKYPFIKTESIGKSCFGRDIKSITLNSAKDSVLITAAFHGSERITALILLKFFEELCDSLKEHKEMCGIDICKALKNRNLTVVPLVNPDGCEISRSGKSGCGEYFNMINTVAEGDLIHWNSNLRGVDINHNFDAGRAELIIKEHNSGIFGPSKTRYSGPFAESEPETKALTSLCRNNFFSSALALHSQGRVIYYDYKNLSPEKSRKMAQIMSACSGYELDTAAGIAEGGGFKDWFISEFSRPAFTVEVGKGKNPLDPYELNALYCEVRELLTVWTIM